MAAEEKFDVFAGELNLTNAQYTNVQWETVLRRIVADPALQPNLRALTLDENDFGSTAVGVALASTVGKLERLVDLSVCDCRLGSGAARLFASLGSVPAFAKPHHEAWSPMDYTEGPMALVPQCQARPPQGARLCLMRNNISDDELLGAPSDGEGVSHSPPPPCLLGVLELGLSGNPRITDRSLAGIGKAFPSLRRLFLGRTGIRGHPALSNVFDQCWPMLEALALNGVPMELDGWELLQRELMKRHRAVENKRLTASAESGEGPAPDHLRGKISREDKTEDDAAHRLFHLDVRDINTINPISLKQLSEKMREYSNGERGVGKQRWVHRQRFSGGRHRSDGLVLRHDFEGTVSLRVEVLLELPNDVDVLLDGDRSAGPFYVMLPDVPQITALDVVSAAFTQAANIKGDTQKKQSKYQKAVTSVEQNARNVKNGSLEQTVDYIYRAKNFPFMTTDGKTRSWKVKRITGPGTVRCWDGDGTAIAGTGRAQMFKVAVGSLLRDQASAEGGRRLDAQFKPPAQSEIRKLVELTVTLHCPEIDKNGAAESAAGDGVAVGGAAMGSDAAASSAQPAPKAGKKRKGPA